MGGAGYSFRPHWSNGRRDYAFPVVRQLPGPAGAMVGRGRPGRSVVLEHSRVGARTPFDTLGLAAGLEPRQREPSSHSWRMVPRLRASLGTFFYFLTRFYSYALFSLRDSKSVAFALYGLSDRKTVV